MKKRIVAVSLFIAGLACAQNAVEYEISFDNAVHHEAEIQVVFAELTGEKLEMRMSRSSPGRYALHEFAKNVYNVRAYDAMGNALKIKRPDPYQWDVMHTGYVRFTYTLFADRAGGTYSGIDESHAHLNVPATFMWARGLFQRPVKVKINVPTDSGWKVATQLKETDDPFIYTAPDFYYFLDSPIEVSDYTLREWGVTAGEDSMKIRIALHHDGTEKEADVYAEMGKAVCYEQEAIFGEFPRFDFGTYTFLADYLPYVAGDGMEHRNSTILSSVRSLKTNAVRNLGTLSHEFIHAWNVERIRPQSLEPFDFEHANMSGELWFAEGVTSYYTPLAIHRAELISLDELALNLSGSLNYVLNSPGRSFFSPVEMSMQAPFVDAARSIDPTNRINTFISYYTYGAVIGLGLDLTLRSEFSNLSLDNLMQEMWRSFGKQEKPYTNEDIKDALAKITGKAAFAQLFFDKYIYGNKVVEYKKLLARAGLMLRRSNPQKAVLGTNAFTFKNGIMKLSAQTRIGTPLYEAGLDKGAVILSMAGEKITSKDALKAFLEVQKVGDKVSLEFKQRGITKTTELILGSDPRLEVIPFERVEMPVTSAIRDFRASWLNSKSKHPKVQLTRTCHKCKRHFSFKDKYCKYDGATLRITPAAK